MLKAGIYIGILGAVFTLGLLGGSGYGVSGSDSANGTVVQIHGHVNQQLYEVIVPAGLVDLFHGEEGHFHCSPPTAPTAPGGLCHIEPMP